MALWIGRPVRRSHRSVVSRWLVMPTASSWAGFTDASRKAAEIAFSVEAQMSSKSCSTHPGRGKICRNSTLRLPRTASRWSRTSAVVPVVPWSIASTYFAISSLLEEGDDRIAHGRSVHVERQNVPALREDPHRGGRRQRAREAPRSAQGGGPIPPAVQDEGPRPYAAGDRHRLVGEKAQLAPPAPRHGRVRAVLVDGGARRRTAFGHAAVRRRHSRKRLDVPRSLADHPGEGR